MNNLYERQDTLDLNPPTTVTVVGLGGVGIWVALNLALSGVKELFLVDFDNLEEHNLNRTPYKSSQIGSPKVIAAQDLINERRIDTLITPILSRIEEIPEPFIEQIKNSVVIDCKDNSNALPYELKSKIIGGYDGMKMSLHINPSEDTVWGDTPTRYETVPSWLCPPQLIANFITYALCTGDLPEDERVINTSMKQIFNNVIEVNNDKEKTEEPEEKE